MSKLDALVSDINKKWKEDIASKGIKRMNFKKIPFTSPRLNYMLYGGLPRGKIIEFSGEENGGKTTTAIDVVKNAQKLFKEEWEAELNDPKTSETRKKYLEARGYQKVVYGDIENTFDEDWARTLGADVDDMYILKPQSQSAEPIFQMILDMIETDEVGLAIVDSLGVMMSQQAYEKDMTEKTYGGISMPLTLFSKKAELLCHKTGCTLIGINQERDNLNSPYGGKTTPGGRAWKYQCVLRMSFAKGSYIDAEGNELNRSCETAEGNKVMVSIIKNKACKPDRKTGFYTLNYTYGIDEVTDMLQVAMRCGVLQKAGAWYSFCDINTGEIVSGADGKELKFQGMNNVVSFIRENEDFREELKNLISEEIA